VRDARLSLAELISNPPRIHNARARTYGIDPRLARFLDEHVERNFVTLETGAGLSTLVILRKGIARHIAIAPAPDEFAAIREFCAENDIPTTGFDPITAGSQDCLPITPLPALNIVLIDGDHAFPVPFLDWYYTADHLLVGGLMIVDDIQLVTGRLLADFMEADPKWERVLYEEARFAVFRKLEHPIHTGRWEHQPFVATSVPVKSVRIVQHVERAPIPPVLAAIYSRLPSRAQALYRRLREVLRADRRSP
jgi:predicted O-methyltransferase YrrM